MAVAAQITELAEYLVQDAHQRGARLEREILKLKAELTKKRTLWQWRASRQSVWRTLWSNSGVIINALVAGSNAKLGRLITLLAAEPVVMTSFGAAPAILK
jgi:uncharacterized small protein (DUF1192 family)